MTLQYTALSKVSLSFYAFREILTWNQYDKCCALIRTHSISSGIYAISLNQKHLWQVAILTFKAVAKNYANLHIKVIWPHDIGMPKVYRDSKRNKTN